MYPRNDNLFIKRWTGCQQHYFIVSKLMRGEKIMGKVISFEDYKKSKEKKLKANCKEEPEDKYLEYYINMDEEERKMVNSWLLEDL